MILTTTILALTAAPTTLHAPIHGIDGWQGIQSITIPGRRARSMQLAKPIALDLKVGGFERSGVLDGMDGELSLQQHDGRFHGVLKSRTQGDWIIRGSIKTGRAVWTPMPLAASEGCNEIFAADDGGQANEHEGHDHQAVDMPVMDGDTGGSSDNGEVLDILVAYTSLARDNAGSTTDMEASIRFWVNGTNDILAGSLVPTRLRLVGTEHVNYNEQGVGFSTHLHAVTEPDDGQMDGIHARRDALGADLVALVVGEASNACGIGWRLQNQNASGNQADAQRTFNATLAFCVVADSCADNSHTLAHEIGHNLGCCHNQGDAGSCQGTARFPAPFGHRFTGDFGVWRSVMAYNDNFNTYTRAPRFSNPDVDWDGAPSGTNSANNADVLSLMRMDTARYRTAVTQASCDGDFDANRDVNVQDLLGLLANWGNAGVHDINNDARVDVADLFVLLGTFGPC